MIRSRYRELAEHLKTKCKELGVRLENFGSEIAEMTLSSGGRNNTEQGLHLADLRYQGVFFIERINTGAAILALIHVRAWLDSNDDTRGRYKLPDPQVSMVKLDGEEDLSDLLLTIEFVDPIYIAPSESGTVEYNGVKYGVEPYDLWVAENGSVMQAPLGVEK